MRRTARNGWGKPPQLTKQNQLYILSTLCKRCESVEIDRKFSPKKDLPKGGRSFFGGLTTEGGN